MVAPASPGRCRIRSATPNPSRPGMTASSRTMRYGSPRSEAAVSAASPASPPSTVVDACPTNCRVRPSSTHRLVVLSSITRTGRSRDLPACTVATRARIGHLEWQGEAECAAAPSSLSRVSWPPAADEARRNAQPQAGSAELARRRSVRLFEGLEHVACCAFECRSRCRQWRTSHRTPDCGAASFASATRT